MVVKMIFDEFQDFERLEALVDVENVGFERVLEKAGFYKQRIFKKFVFI